MNNSVESKSVNAQIKIVKKECILNIFLGLLTIGSIILYYIFFPYKWTSNFLFNIILVIAYIHGSIFSLLFITNALDSMPKFRKCLEVAGNELQSKLFLEELEINKEIEKKAKEKAAEETRRKSAIIGNVYAVITKESQLTEIWFTEDETGWDLMQKFGWMQYKRVRKPYPSSTHNIHLVARNVEFDAKFHKQLKDPFITEDERKLRREKYFRDTTADYPFSIYAVNYRLNKHLSTISVRHVDEEIYLARLVRDEFITVVKVCDKVKLSKAMTSAVYKVENSA